MTRLVAAMLVAAVAALPAAGGSMQTPSRGGSLIVPGGGGPEPSCLNPFGPCDFFSNRPYLQSVLAGAFKVGPDHTYRPNLVSGADIVSKRPFVVEYRLRREARWSDGVPVTAADFVFTHRIFRDYKIFDAAEFDRRPAYRTILRVDPVDAKTARVVFRERFADWRTLFEHVLPRHVLVGQDITEVWRTGIDDPRTGRPIGSGPFLIGSWDRGKHLTLVRNRRYWGAHTAYLDRLFAGFRVPGVVGPVALMQGGHRDVLLLVGQDSTVVDALREMPGVTVKSATSSGLEYLLFRLGSGGHPALKIRLVRQALAYGLNRSAIARVRSGDARLKADSAVLSRDSRFYRPTWSTYRFDPVNARRLLEQAGCERGRDEIYICGRDRLSLRFLTVAGNPARQRTLELIQEQLRESGIEARPEYAPTIDSLMQNHVKSGEFDVALVSIGASNGRIPGPYCGGHDGNYTGYCSRLTTRDLHDADLSVDERQRARALNAADAKLARDVPVIPLTALRFDLVYRSQIRGITVNVLDPLWNVEDWWLQR